MAHCSKVVLSLYIALEIMLSKASIFQSTECKVTCCRNMNKILRNNLRSSNCQSLLLLNHLLNNTCVKTFKTLVKFETHYKPLKTS